MDWRTVTFDCYGTLVDWETGITRAFAEEAARDGLDLSAEEVISAYHDVEPQVQADRYRPYRDVLRETACRVAEKLGWTVPPARSAFLAESLADWPIFADTRPALERLRARFELSILSNIDDDLLHRTIERIGIDFAWTVTAQQTRSYKPDRAHFTEAIRRVGGRKERLLHVAQSQFHDVRPATQLGLTVVWVNRQAEPAERDLRPSHIVSDLAELADWLGV